MIFKKSIIILSVLATLCFTSRVNAQSFSFQMAPQLHEVISQPGKTVVLPYSLTNIGDPQVITVSIYTIQVTDNTGNYSVKPYIAEENGITFKALGGALELDQPVVIRSNQTAEFDIEVTIPSELQESDYAFSVIAETEVQKGFNNASEIQINGGIASNILLTVSSTGAKNAKGQVVQFDILSPKSITFKGQKVFFFNSNEPIPIMLIASNNGSNYTKTSGSITLLPQYSDKKSELPSFTIHPQYILAGSQRILQTTTDPVCETNESTICKKDHSLIIKSPFIGIYKLAAVVSFGESSQIGYANIMFITFPFVYTTIGVLLLVLAFFILLRMKKNLGHS